MGLGLINMSSHQISKTVWFGKDLSLSLNLSDGNYTLLTVTAIFTFSSDAITVPHMMHWPHPPAGEHTFVILAAFISCRNPCQFSFYQLFKAR